MAQKLDPATEDYFQALGELDSLLGNHVGHLPEPPVTIPVGKIKPPADCVGECDGCGADTELWFDEAAAYERAYCDTCTKKREGFCEFCPASPGATCAVCGTTH